MKQIQSKIFILVISIVEPTIAIRYALYGVTLYDASSRSWHRIEHP